MGRLPLERDTSVRKAAQPQEGIWIVPDIGGWAAREKCGSFREVVGADVHERSHPWELPSWTWDQRLMHAALAPSPSEIGRFPPAIREDPCAPADRLRAQTSARRFIGNLVPKRLFLASMIILEANHSPRRLIDTKGKGL